MEWKSSNVNSGSTSPQNSLNLNSPKWDRRQAAGPQTEWQSLWMASTENWALEIICRAWLYAFTVSKHWWLKTQKRPPFWPGTGWECCKKVCFLSAGHNLWILSRLYSETAHIQPSRRHRLYVMPTAMERSLWDLMMAFVLCCFYSSCHICHTQTRQMPVCDWNTLPSKQMWSIQPLSYHYKAYN